MDTPRITDIHTHAFPDALATRAMAHLEAEGDIKGCHDGTLCGLLARMDQAGVDRSVLCSIATKPSQFDAILAWSREIVSERTVPLASVHPDDLDLVAHLQQVHEAGLQGIKLHPYYQDFVLDEERLTPLWTTAADLGLLVVPHCGWDIAFPPDDRCAPERIARVVAAYPGLRLVATHLGGWRLWDEAERWLIGQPVYLETSMTFEWGDPALITRLIEAHPPEYLLFGSDSPWGTPAADVARLRSLGLGAEREALLLGGNAERLLRQA